MKLLKTSSWLCGILYFVFGIAVYVNSTAMTYMMLWGNWYSFLDSELWSIKYCLAIWVILAVSIYLPMAAYSILTSMLANRINGKWKLIGVLFGVVPVSVAVKLIMLGLEPDLYGFGDAIVFAVMLGISLIIAYFTKNNTGIVLEEEHKSKVRTLYKAYLPMGAVLILFVIACVLGLVQKSIPFIHIGDLFFGCVLAIVALWSYRRARLGNFGIIHINVISCVFMLAFLGLEFVFVDETPILFSVENKFKLLFVFVSFILSLAVSIICSSIGSAQAKREK